jgi:predicted GNAT family acetyltransferase
MTVRVLEDAGAFLEQAGPLLLADEARHNLILGISGTLRESPDRYAEKHFWVGIDDGEPVAAAIRTPPYNLILATPRDEPALVALAAAIEDELPGVTGTRPEVDTFARLWADAHGLEARTLRGMGVYALEHVQPVPPAPGSSRPATRADEEILLEWMIAFGEEVLEDNDPGRTEARAAVEHKLSGHDGGFTVWEDEGRVVSVSGWGGPTPNGIRVGPVYTPPELRGRGYATALVAELSQTLIDSGRSFIFLYTDLANPTSNAIYERIGYVRVAESAMIEFLLA